MALTLTSTNESFISYNQKYCLFCFKPALEIKDGDQTQTQTDDVQLKNRIKEKMELVDEFYKLVCPTQNLITASENPEKGSAKSSLSASICENCYRTLKSICKLSQKISSLQQTLNWQMDQLHSTMKSASRISSRKKDFKKSFQHQFVDNDGELIVAIKKGQLEKAMECRQKIIDACASTSLSNPTLVSAQQSHDSDSDSDTCDYSEVKEMVKVEINSSDDEDVDVIGNENGDEANDDDISSQDSDPDIVEIACNYTSAIEETGRDPIRKKRKISTTSNDDQTQLTQILDNDMQLQVFQCFKENCGKVHPSQESLERHQQEHGSFPCNFCDFHTDFARTLVDHELEQHTQGTKDADKTKCPRCPKFLTTSKYNQNKHYFRFHFGFIGNGKAKCEFCGKEFTGWTSSQAIFQMKKHVQSHYKGKLKCTICGNKMKNQTTLSAHLKRIHGKSQVKETEPVITETIKHAQKKSTQKRVSSSFKDIEDLLLA